MKSGFPLDRPAVLRAYRRLAPVYNLLFGSSLEPGRRRVVEALAVRPGERILEVGVGTGLSLRHWDPRTRVTGIDLCPSMLQRAERERVRRGLAHVELQEMDATAMAFPDDSFDKVAAMYVASVVPDLEALLREMRRVCRPGGRIAIVNHFAHRGQGVGRSERWLTAYSGLLGFNPSLGLDRVTDSPDLEILEVRPANWFDYWTLVLARPAK